MGEWFESWFDSKYYHLLYENRDDKEAQQFLTKLLTAINIPSDSRVLDLACGKGRHSIFLNQMGYHVTGVDLSENSIKQASQSQNERLHFFVHDMRDPLPIKDIDLALNLFTSFGYFEKNTENEAVLGSLRDALKNDGILVIDFLNTHWVKANMKPLEEKNCGSTQFIIRKRVDGNFIQKTIEFNDETCQREFTERVQLLELSDFEAMFQKTGFRLQKVYGDYNLGTFAPASSERLIMIAVKS